MVRCAVTSKHVAQWRTQNLAGVPLCMLFCRSSGMGVGIKAAGCVFMLCDNQALQAVTCTVVHCQSNTHIF
jgi:hypothetical protein